MSIDKVVRYKSIKLDGRYAGYRDFSHYVTVALPRGSIPTHDAITEFNKIRNWCITTWGPSCELYDYEYIKRMRAFDSDYVINEYWSWYVKDNSRRLYLTAKAKVWFDLTWL